jgi:hypothetical protein
MQAENSYLSLAFKEFNLKVVVYYYLSYITRIALLYLFSLVGKVGRLTRLIVL